MSSRTPEFPVDADFIQRWSPRSFTGKAMDRAELMSLFEAARWTPSTSNTQPWRFEIVDDFNVVVHGFDTRDHCVYDLDGRPSQISLGALLETIAIAASGHGREMVVRRRAGLP